MATASSSKTPSSDSGGSKRGSKTSLSSIDYPSWSDVEWRNAAYANWTFKNEVRKGCAKESLTLLEISCHYMDLVIAQSNGGS